jgi:hypothetical protein
VCEHKDRALIESALVAGVSVTALANKHGVSTDSIYRHGRNHLTEADRAALVADIPIKDLAAKAAEHGGALLDYYQIIRATLFRNFQTVAANGDIAGANNTARAVLEVCRDIARLTGELLNAAPVTNITTNNYNLFTQSAAFANLQAMLVQRLSPYPEALAAVVAGLEALDAQAGSNPPAGAPLIDLQPLPIQGDDPNGE